MKRRTFLRSTAAAAAVLRLPQLEAAEALPPIIPAPANPGDWDSAREHIRQWREQSKRELHYNDALYRRSDFAWVPSFYSCGFLMLNDEAVYSPKSERFEIDAFIEQGWKDFGGYDGVVLWHAYPRIGIDDRNQFDFYRDQPGGLPGLKALSRACHSRGVKVFLDYNPWDTGTRRERGSDIEILASLVEAIEADGVFLDTLDRGAAEFRTALDHVRRGVVLESEGALPIERIADHHTSWAQWFDDGRVPGVLRNRWFERRHQQHQIRRWDRDHTSELQIAWMNGAGMLVWENVFGSWVGWNARDRSILRAMLPIQRRYASLFSGENWKPWIDTATPDVYASLWEGNGVRLWTMVNRAEQERRVPLPAASASGRRYFDLVGGEELSQPVGIGLAPRGIGAILEAELETAGTDFKAFLESQKATNQLRSFDTAFPTRTAILTPPPASASFALARVPESMMVIPATEFSMNVEFRIRECGFYEAQTENNLIASRLHQTLKVSRAVHLPGYAIDLTLVTNLQFAEFLKASGYQPKHPANFLKHWQNGAPPPEKSDHPVVYVDLNDARAFAAWAGKRLPTEEEWQYAAQGPQLLRYPWGAEMRADVCNTGPGTSSVTAHPRGRSYWGCDDMCGNIWQWTESERRDGRTRFCIIRGGSWYRAQGSEWYTDGGPQPATFACKFLLMWPGLDRCATIGFRCAASVSG